MGDSLSFIKWAGGKKQLLSQFKDFFPKYIERYFEPFVGGGAVAFHILKKYQPKKVYLSDINEELINCYNIIKNNPQELIQLLSEYRKNHSKEFYYQIREQDPKLLSSLNNAARFIYLNKTCFNGLYRVNSSGKFNVPMGSYKNPSIYDESELMEISKILKKTNLRVIPFNEIIKSVKKDDFIYFDPPYHPLNNKNSFTTYTKGSFRAEDQKKLAELYKELDKKGCKVMLSNSDTEFIKELYSKYNINLVKASRMINCDGSKRGKINELVITNYRPL